MEFNKALAKIEEADLGEEVIKAIKGRMEELVTKRNKYSDEVESWKKKAASLQTLAETLGVAEETKGKDLGETLTSLSKAIDGLNKEKEGLTKQVAEKDEASKQLQAQLTGKEKELLVFRAASLAKVNPRVLGLMAKEVELEVSDGKVMVKPTKEGDKPVELKEFVEGSEEWKPLSSALWTGSEGRVPDGKSSHGSGGKTTSDRLSKSLSSKYGLSEAS